MNSASWASYKSAAELPDRDDDEPSPPIGGFPPDDIGMLQDAGYKAHRDEIGRWSISRPAEEIGTGATAVEAWDAAIRWMYDKMAAENDEAMRQAEATTGPIELSPEDEVENLATQALLRLSDAMDACGRVAPMGETIEVAMKGLASVARERGDAELAQRIIDARTALTV